LAVINRRAAADQALKITVSFVAKLLNASRMRRERRRTTSVTVKPENQNRLQSSGDADGNTE
jgi:hypothetical protein